MLKELRLDERARIWCTACKPKKIITGNYFDHLKEHHPERYVREIKLEARDSRWK